MHIAPRILSYMFELHLIGFRLGPFRALGKINEIQLINARFTVYVLGILYLKWLEEIHPGKMYDIIDAFSAPSYTYKSNAYIFVVLHYRVR